MATVRNDWNERRNVPALAGGVDHIVEIGEVIKVPDYDYAGLVAQRIMIDEDHYVGWTGVEPPAEGSDLSHPSINPQAEQTPAEIAHTFADESGSPVDSEQDTGNGADNNTPHNEGGN